MTHLPRKGGGVGTVGHGDFKQCCIFLFDFAPFALSLPPTLLPASCMFPGTLHHSHHLYRETARSPDQTHSSIIGLKMFDMEVRGLRWFVFTWFQTKRKQQRTQRVKCSHCFPVVVFLFLFFYSTASSVITGRLLWIAISRSGNMRTLWEEQESCWTNIKRERSKRKKKTALHTNIVVCALEK